MARHGVIISGFLAVQGTDLSNGVRRIDYNLTADAMDDWGFGDGTMKRYAPGGVDWSITLEGFQDYASAAFNDVMEALITGRTTFIFVIGRDKDTVSQTYPRWSGTGMLEQYQPMSGAKGENAFATFVIRPSGDSNTLTKLTA